MYLSININKLNEYLALYEKAEGKLYQFHPKVEKNSPEMEKFIEMCFDPSSPMNARLKETLKAMMKEETAE